MSELKQCFEDHPLIPTASEFMTVFRTMEHIPTKWTANTVRTYLVSAGAITYSKAKPTGYSLNKNALDQMIANPPFMEDPNQETTETDDSTIEPSVGSEEIITKKTESAQIITNKKVSANPAQSNESKVEKPVTTPQKETPSKSAVKSHSPMYTPSSKTK